MPHLLCEDWKLGRNKGESTSERAFFVLLIISIFRCLQRQWCCCITLAPCIGNEWELHTVSVRVSIQRDLGGKKGLYTLKNKCMQPGTFKYTSSSECWLMLHQITIKIAPKAQFLIWKRVIMISFTNNSSSFERSCVFKRSNNDPRRSLVWGYSAGPAPNLLCQFLPNKSYSRVDFHLCELQVYLKLLKWM